MGVPAGVVTGVSTGVSTGTVIVGDPDGAASTVVLSIDTVVLSVAPTVPGVVALRSSTISEEGTVTVCARVPSVPSVSGVALVSAGISEDTTGEDGCDVCDSEEIGVPDTSVSTISVEIVV